MPHLPIAHVRIGSARRLHVRRTGERRRHQPVIQAVDHHHGSARARKACRGLRDAGLHAARVVAVAGLQRTQALQSRQGEVRRCQLRVHDAHARTRRNAAAVRPPCSTFCGARRTCTEVRILRGERESARMLAHAVAAIGRGVGDGHRAPQVEAHAQGAGHQRVVGPAVRLQLRPGRGGLRLGIATGDQARRLERGAARGPQRLDLCTQRRLRQRLRRQVQQRARHQQCGFGRVVVQRTRARRIGGVDVGLTGDDGIQPAALLFAGTQDRAPAIGNADRDDARIVEAERRRLRERLVQRGQRELGGLLHVPAPVRFRIVLGMRVLDRHAAGTDRRVGREGQRIGAQRAHRAVLARALLLVQVEVVRARALVGVGDGAALR